MASKIDYSATLAAYKRELCNQKAGNRGEEGKKARKGQRKRRRKGPKGPGMHFWKFAVGPPGLSSRALLAGPAW